MAKIGNNRNITPKIQCPDLTSFVIFSHKKFNYLNILQEGSAVFAIRIYYVARLTFK